ncbi:MAG: ABC transporter ATP-binding protein [Gammaproteobacteria bacterium]
MCILSGIDLTVHPAEVVAITGASGSGKTTLLAALAGLAPVDAGEIWLCGQPLHQFSEEQRAASRLGQVGFVFQDFQLISDLTALENVQLPLELMQAGRATARAIESLEQVGLESRLHHYPAQLSGGERQRVALARAFCIKPRLLFADEPTGNLDEVTSQSVMDILLQPSQDMAVVLVTHDPLLADRCNRQYRLSEGLLR